MQYCAVFNPSAILGFYSLKKLFKGAWHGLLQIYFCIENTYWWIITFIYCQLFKYCNPPLSCFYVSNLLSENSAHHSIWLLLLFKWCRLYLTFLHFHFEDIHFTFIRFEWNAYLCKYSLLIFICNSLHIKYNILFSLKTFSKFCAASPQICRDFNWRCTCLFGFVRYYFNLEKFLSSKIL